MRILRIILCILRNLADSAYKLYNKGYRKEDLLLNLKEVTNAFDIQGWYRYLLFHLYNEGYTIFLKISGKFYSYK